MAVAVHRVGQRIVLVPVVAGSAAVEAIVSAIAVFPHRVPVAREHSAAQEADSAAVRHEPAASEERRAWVAAGAAAAVAAEEAAAAVAVVVVVDADNESTHK